jgi:cytochrome c oxidase subunit 2
MTRILAVLIIALVVIAIAQLSRIHELSKKIRNRKEEDISDAANRINAALMMVSMFVYFGYVIWQMVVWGPYMLPEAASEHGESIDNLFTFNWLIILPVFFVVHFLLFYFSSKYYYRKGRKAYYLTHNNKLEFIWTIVPSIALAGIIIFGLITWNKIQHNEDENPLVIELYAKQFDWTARYSGNDNDLGKANYLLVSGTNPLGVMTEQSINEKLAEYNEEIEKLEASLGEVMPDEQREEVEHKIALYHRFVARIMDMRNTEGNINAGADDRIVKGEFHLPVGKEVEFLIRAQDVIHSAYMPHFRMQMNAVPGEITRFVMKPTITTEEMRSRLDNPEFNYILLCNKICGAAHYNMQMNVIVESQAEYDMWIAEQKTFLAEEIQKGEEEVKKELAEIK